jgi:hypothetical protein
MDIDGNMAAKEANEPFTMDNNVQRDARTSILRQYASATEHYAWTVGELERQRGNLPKHKYDQLYLLVEEARS